jgi:hypothetical protein
LADIRDFRRSVSVLKKQGLLGDAKIDARSVLPSSKVRGKRLDTLIKKYDDVVSGKVTALKVPPSELKKFRASGFETAQGRVLVPHTKGEIAKVRAGQVAITNKTGIERVQLPVEFHNLKQYLEDIKKNATLIDRMKRNNEYFGIRFFGGQRANFYGDIQLLLRDLERYEDIQKRASKAKQAEIYRNLEIIKITDRAAGRVEQEIQTRKRKMSKEYNRQHAKKVYRRLRGKGIGAIERYNARKAETMREYRKRLKRNPKQYAEYKKDARKRAKKFLTNLKKSKKVKPAKKVKRTKKRAAKRKK